MQGINGYRVAQFPISGLRKISDLIYFDGPLLTHFINENGDNFLFYWVDIDKLYNRWVVFESHIADINDFLNKKITLFSLLKKTNNVYVVDIDNNLVYQNVWLTLTSDLPEIYIPEEDSYYDEEVLSDDVNLNYYSSKYEKGILQVHFGKSDKVGYGSIDFDFFSKAMLHFSEMNNSLGNSFYKTERKNQLDNNKKIANLTTKESEKKITPKEDFFNEIKFQVFATQAASFAVLLKTSSNQLAFDDGFPTVADKYVEFLMNFINSSENVNELKEFVGNNLGITAINHYESFLKLLEENQCNFELGYLNVKSLHNYSKKIDEGQTCRIIRNLGLLDYDHEESMKLQGRFISLNIKNGSYSFEGEDDKSFGKLRDSAFERSYNIAFNKTYNVTIERRVSKKAAGKKPNRQDILIDFAEVSDIKEVFIG